MNIRPELAQVKAYAETGKYRVFPVSCEMLSDVCTPIEALQILKNVSTHCYLLESVAEKETWGATRSSVSTRNWQSPVGTAS